MLYVPEARPVKRKAPDTSVKALSVTGCADPRKRSLAPTLGSAFTSEPNPNAVTTARFTGSRVFALTTVPAST
jgi:hypothetical protein